MAAVAARIGAPYCHAVPSALVALAAVEVVTAVGKVMVGSARRHGVGGSSRHQRLGGTGTGMVWRGCMVCGACGAWHSPQTSRVSLLVSTRVPNTEAGTDDDAVVGGMGGAGVVHDVMCV